MTFTPAQDLDLICDAARTAGALALDFFRGAPRRWIKDDRSAVTEADIAVDTMLRERMAAARPDYGWLSEEHPDDGSRHGVARHFIVDPIDGTRAFIDRGDEWVVSIAIAEGPDPVAGVLFNPVRDELWSASRGQGARKDGARLSVSQPGSLAGARIAASRKAVAQLGLPDPDMDLDRSFAKSLAYRIAKVAQGEVDAALAADGAADWDIAAAVLILREAGGIITDADGGPVVLNGTTPRHPPLIAAGSQAHGMLVAAMHRDRAVAREEHQ